MGDVHESVNACGPLVSENMMAGAIRDPWVNPVACLADELQETIRFYDGFLEEVGIEADIDEVAVMFNHREEMWGWLQGAVSEPNVRIFNHARDHVTTSPIESRYDVEYTFLESSALPWRIEAMLLTDGHSPLHAAVRANRVGGAHIIHASFKCHTTREFREAVEKLNDEGQCSQMCHSTYGRFGYWTINGDIIAPGVRPLYLKPRFNSRDAR